MKQIIRSFFLFLAAHLLPVYFYGCIFLFLIPLFIRARLKKLMFLEGVVWGTLTFGLHLYWLLALVVTKCIALNGSIFHVSAIKGVCLYLLVVAWCGLLSGAWFFLMRYSLLLATWIFFMVLHLGVTFFYIIDGYPIFNPLVVLAARPELIWFISITREGVGLFLLIALQEAIALFWIKRSMVFILVALVVAVPFCSGFIFYKQQQKNRTKMKYICPVWQLEVAQGHKLGTIKTAMSVGCRILSAIGDIYDKNQKIKTILMPESTFCWNMYEYEQFYYFWCKNAPGVTILFGGHRCQDGATINSVFAIKDGELLFVYDKQHLMPIVEQNLSWLYWFNNLLGDCDQAAKPLNSSSSDDIISLQGKLYQIFICSELFFEAKKVKGYPVLLFFNELWLQSNYAKQLAILYINYFEIKHNVIVLYMSTEGRHNIIDCSEQ